jgi:hypothetical protein
MRPPVRPLAIPRTRVTVCNMKRYRVQGFHAPQVIPILSGVLTHDEAKKYRADLTAKGVHPSDIWITEVDEHEAAKNIKKLPRGPSH